MKYVAQITVFVELEADDETHAAQIADEVCDQITSIDHDELVTAQVYEIREEDEACGDDDEGATP